MKTVAFLDPVTNPALSSGLQDTGGGDFLSGLLSGVVTLGFIVGSIVFFFMLLWGALQWMTSGGDKQALESAKGRISNAFVGLIVLFSIFAIINLLGYFFGFDNFLQFDLESLRIGG